MEGARSILAVVPPVVLANPILNAPFEEPLRHYRFSDEGITDEIVEGRRASGYFLRIVDVYDPTTGQIRTASTDDVACWFIDTNYDGESFFVRHAYFTGADEPYEKLKRALRAEIDEAAWSSLYSTVSRAFALPETGRIAVKVINHYGDEVLKVFKV